MTCLYTASTIVTDTAGTLALPPYIRLYGCEYIAVIPHARRILGTEVDQVLSCWTDPEVLLDWIADVLFLQGHCHCYTRLQLVGEAYGCHSVGDYTHQADNNLYECNPEEN